MPEPRRSRDINRDVLGTDYNWSASDFSAPGLSVPGTPISESAPASLALFHGLMTTEQDK